MKALLPRPSMFGRGSHSTFIEADNEDQPGIELFPVVELVRSYKIGKVAGRLAVACANNPSLKLWLPGPANRYSTKEGAEKALHTVANAHNIIAWIILRTSNHTVNNAFDHDAVLGIATIHEDQRVAVNGVRLAGRYALVSYWTDSQATTASEDRAIAETLFTEVPRAVLKPKYTSNVVASLDGPVYSDEIGDKKDVIFDPSAAFADVGRLWEGAQIVDGSTQDTADGIITNRSTRLYVPLVS